MGRRYSDGIRLNLMSISKITFLPSLDMDVMAENGDVAIKRSMKWKLDIFFIDRSSENRTMDFAAFDESSISSEMLIS